MTNIRRPRYGQTLRTILSRRNKKKGNQKRDQLKGRGQTDIKASDQKKSKKNPELEHLRFEYKKMKRTYEQLKEQQITETTLRKLQNLYAKIKDQEKEKFNLKEELSDFRESDPKKQKGISKSSQNSDSEDNEIQQKKKKIEKLTKSIDFLKSNQKINFNEKVNSKQTKLKNLTNETNLLLLDLSLLKEDLKIFKNPKQQNKEDEEKIMIQEKILNRIREQYSQQKRKAKKIEFDINNLQSMNKSPLDYRQTQSSIKIKCSSIQVENEKLQHEIDALKQLKASSENKTARSESETSYSDFSSNISHNSNHENTTYTSDSDNSFSIQKSIKKRNTINLKKSPSTISKGLIKLKIPSSLSTKTRYHRTISELTETATHTDGSESFSISFSDSCNSEQDFGNKITRFEGNTGNNEELWHNQINNGLTHYSKKKTHRTLAISTQDTEKRTKKRSHSVYFISNVTIKPKSRNNNDSEDSLDLPNMDMINKYKLLMKQQQPQQPQKQKQQQQQQQQKQQQEEEKKKNEQEDRNENNEEKENKYKNVDIPSLEVLLTIPKGVAYFKEFLCVHLNQENLLFFQNVKDYKANCQTQKQINKEAKKIIKKYIIPSSIFEINIESKMRQKILDLHSVSNYSTIMFDQAQQTAYNHMNLNSWESFTQTNLFKILLKELMQDQNYQYNPNVKKSKLIYPIKKKIVLNEEIEYLGKYHDAEKLSAELLKKLTQILMTFYKISSNNINLQLVSKSLIYRKFVKETSHLQRIRLNNLDKQQKFCFFINIYNLLFLNGLINYGIPSNRNEVKRFYQKCCYRICNDYFCLKDIYHGILRANNTHKLSLRNQNYFKKTDARGKLSLKKVQPQFHFALINFHFNVQLQIFTSNNIEQNLKSIAQNVLTKLVKFSNKKLLLPNIFKLYEKDFGGIKNILNWINSNSSNSLYTQNTNIHNLVIKYPKNSLVNPNFIIMKEQMELKNQFL
ncbi:electron carrier/ protein disulfide oxidoreductase [Anaeramoeba flamelloides]|uniref:Electron carrier/ protein disulfide oxidoreductase n=1 Tax=Anaeramoeba flamelloides TaxID=1746091 RepID=A0ABQ8X1T7_9EUKA|nr:electron carrier/ protein disulfide oxidoreductase [Anaeramoeba flamelloides]